MSAGAWLAKLSVIVVIYLADYLYVWLFHCWKSAAVRAYYGGHDPGSFFTQLASVLRDQPSLFLLQVARALLWTAIAMPSHTNDERQVVGSWIAVALLFAVTSSHCCYRIP
jgi:hypothetical protein